MWETSRGRHVPDEDVIAEAIWLPQASQNHLTEDGVKKYVLTCFNPYGQRVGLRENLQETIDFPMNYGIFV